VTLASESHTARNLGADATASPHVANLAENRMVRFAWGGLGTFSLGLGIVGVVLPGWPTTIFLIIAAACYARSSQRMYDRIVNNRAFGPHVRRFRETGAMPKRAKVLSLGLMWPFVLFAVLVAIPRTLPWAQGLTLILAVAGTIYILHLPTDRSVDSRA
jgi:uncharacterized membrane protein YbaN (DUF454 family)